MSKLLFAIILFACSIPCFAQADTTIIWYRFEQIADGDTVVLNDALTLNQLCLVGDSLFYLHQKDTVYTGATTYINDTPVVEQVYDKTIGTWQFVALYKVSDTSAVLTRKCF